MLFGLPFRRTMTNLTTYLLLLGKMLVALLAISTLLLIAGRDLFSLMSPVDLLLSADDVFQCLPELHCEAPVGNENDTDH